MFNKFLIFLFLFSLQAHAQMKQISGFNLTENGGTFVYDASADNNTLTEAQNRVLQARQLGANHIILNVRAKMIGGRSSEIIPVTPPSEKQKEAQRMVRLIKYIKSIGMSVGIRPIFFVVGPNGEFPYSELQSDGRLKLWWHGNIQPSDPNRWFESFRNYLDQYMLIAKLAQADEFTIGAELYSMTVGIEDQWPENPYGFPGRWLELLRYVRAKIPKAQLHYDINYTDDTVNNGALLKAGGEIERWRYRLVDLAEPEDPAQAQIWKDLVAFWTELDAIGIDMYRSLAGPTDLVPLETNSLVKLLRLRSDAYASQLDNILTEISIYLSHDKKIVLKEVGFRSVENGFIDPFTYAGPGSYNEAHQYAAVRALFESFIDPQWSWFGGVNLWDLPIDPSLNGQGDTGFSPVGKKMTEDLIRKYYQQ